MKQSDLAVGFLLCAMCLAGIAACQEQPEVVGVCQLKNDPVTYNRKLVKVTAFVSHDFEDFTLFDPACPSYPNVWLEYGGKSRSGTMYCCGVTADRKRLEELQVEDIPITLVDNEQFREFDRLVQPPFRSGHYGSIVHATLEGRFFAGRRQPLVGGRWGGYGHMGCCTLFAIQKIVSVDPQDRQDLDYGASPDQPDVNKVGCGYQIVTPLDPTADNMEAQKQADAGGPDWIFADPRRVAAVALSRLPNFDNQSPSDLMQTREAQGRLVYERKMAKHGETYMVVVSRPYWLSFYARDPKRVAWVVVAAYVSSCANKSGMTRIR